jgi:hypothetical protein
MLRMPIKVAAQTAARFPNFEPEPIANWPSGLRAIFFSGNAPDFNG